MVHHRALRTPGTSRAAEGNPWPGAAGGGTDVDSRMRMLWACRELKQDLVVVNKRGGGGAATMNFFMTRPADGNTIMTFTVGHAITMAKGKTRLKAGVKGICRESGWPALAVSDHDCACLVGILVGPANVTRAAADLESRAASASIARP